MPRYIEGLENLALVFERGAALHDAIIDAVAGAASTILYKHAHETFGDSEKLADLAPATQDDREKKGYAPNEPLLRDGTLLRDSVERIHEGSIAGIGSDEEVMLYHEYGYHNARTGTDVPARPVFRIAMMDSIEDIEPLIMNGIRDITGVGSLTVLPDEE